MVMKYYDVPLNIVNYITEANESIPKLRALTDLKDEAELERFSDQLIIKRGLPQGLS
jgi:hypothetical protein